MMPRAPTSPVPVAAGWLLCAIVPLAIATQAERITKAMAEDRVQHAAAPPTSRPTYVYVISHPSGSIKVGVSGDPESRLAALQTGNSELLQLRRMFRFPSRAQALRAEKAVHEAMADARLGGEWFDDYAVPGGCGIEGLFPRDTAWMQESE